MDYGQYLFCRFWHVIEYNIRYGKIPKNRIQNKEEIVL